MDQSWSIANPSETMSHPTEELRGDLERCMVNYGSLTVCEVLGVIELVKAGYIDRIRRLPNDREDRTATDTSP